MPRKSKKQDPSSVILQLTKVLNEKAEALQKIEEGHADLLRRDYIVDLQSAMDTAKGDAGVEAYDQQGHSKIQSGKDIVATLDTVVTELESQLLAMGVEVLEINTNLPLGPNQERYDIAYQQRRRKALAQFR